MRLTLRTMLAYLDDVLTEADSHELGQKIDSSDFATGLVHRIRNSISQLRLSSPELLGSDSMDDPNTVAEFIDSSLSPEREQEFEKTCLQSDKHLAEVASSHQILTMVLGTPARVSPRLRDRVYRTGIPGDGADTRIPPTGRGEAFHRIDVTDAAMAFEDSGPIEIKRPRSVSDSRAALAEFSEGRNLWPIAAALLLGFLLTGGFLFAMGPLNSSHPLAGLLGLRDVQVADSPNVPETLPSDTLDRPKATVPEAPNIELPADVVPSAPPIHVEDDRMPDVPSPQFSEPELASRQDVPPLEVPQSNGDWELPEQGSEAQLEDGPFLADDVQAPALDEQLPVFDQAPDFPIATDSQAVTPESGSLEGGTLFDTTDVADPVVEPNINEIEAPLAGQGNSLALDASAVADPQGPLERSAMENDLVEEDDLLESDSVGFDELVADEDAPPLPDLGAPDVAIPDPNLLVDRGPFPESLDESLRVDPVVEAAPGGLRDDSDSNVSAPDPTQTADAIQPEPEVPAEVGRFLSEEQVLLYWDDQTATWMRLPPRTAFGVGHRLRMLENYRTQLLLSPSNIQFTSRGDSEIVFAEPLDAQTPTLEVPYGRFLLNSTSQGGSRFALQTNGRTVVVEFSEPNTEVVCQVRPVLLPGADPRREPAHRIVQIWVTLGSAKVMENDREEQIDMGRQYAFADDIEARIVAFNRVPEWFTNRIDPVDRDAALELEPLLPLNRDVVLSLSEAADNRRTDVRFWSMRNLVSLGELRTAASLFSVADRKHQHAWPKLFDEFRAVIARDSESAAAVQKVFSDLYGAEGAKLYRMLVGFDNDQLRAGAADQLVEDLTHPRVEFRIFAIQNLKRITGKTLTYSPVLGEKFRATKVARWKNELKQGKVLMTKPSNGVLSPSQRDLADWNGLTEPLLP